MTTGFIYLQLILGATIRHTGHAVVPHMIVAFLIVIHVILVLVRVMQLGTGPLKGPVPIALTLGIATVVQIFLGMGSFIFTRLMASGYSPSLAQVVFTAAHQTTGALVLGTSVLLTLRVSR